MNKRLLSKLLVCLLVFSSIFVITACGKDAEETPITNPIEITISISYPQKAQLENVEDASFRIEEDSTVLDALQLYCNVYEFPLTVETTDASVEGINDVMNGDFGTKRHWQYKLNGTLCETPESEMVLQDGDVVEWIYQK